MFVEKYKCFKKIHIKQKKQALQSFHPKILYGGMDYIMIPKTTQLKRL